MLIGVELERGPCVFDVETNILTVALAIEVPGLAFDLLGRVIPQDCEAGSTDFLFGIGTEDIELQTVEIRGASSRNRCDRRERDHQRKSEGNSGSAQMP